ncbi:MAG: hypothetical protein KA957_03530 [Syntrophaceae bacterium]|jgi:hypothetical protein|nr:hypothetical protein [Syntrophaceae bacterium]
MNGITRDTFASMNTDSKLMVLYDLVQENHQCSCEIQKQLQFKKKVDWSLSAALGLIGGMISGAGIRIIK